MVYNKINWIKNYNNNISILRIIITHILILTIIAQVIIQIEIIQIIKIIIDLL